MLSDDEIVHEIMGDPDRKERFRMALRRFMQTNHPVQWTLKRSRMLKVVDEMVDNPAITKELVSICRAMYPFRGATDGKQ